jgi:hypothetical protein
MDQIDIYRAANLLIKQRPFDAAAEAVRRCAELSASQDDAGSQVWWEISKAIMIIQRQQPVANENTN